MKKSINKIIIIKFVLVLTFMMNAQNKLNDPSIVAQHKRQVYENWGDWRPYPKYNILGIQTNFAYATVWGWLSPNINQDYKNGQDIRPLKPTGEEVQRLGELKLEEKEAEDIKKEVDTLYKRNVQDFAHWTSATVIADPLWLLYYKKMLKPLNDFPNNPQNYWQWEIKDDPTYQNMLSNGAIENLKKELDLLKDKYHQSRTLDMPRGKRFLMYHETLIGWRKFIKQIRLFSQKNNLFLEYKSLLVNLKNSVTPTSSRTDKEIVTKIMKDYQNKF